MILFSICSHYSRGIKCIAVDLISVPKIANLEGALQVVDVLSINATACAFKLQDDVTIPLKDLWIVLRRH